MIFYLATTQTISKSSQEVQVFFREVRSCWGAGTYEELLHVITGLEQIVILMLLSICFKTLRDKCQGISSLPLVNFDSLRKIHSYLGKLSSKNPVREAPKTICFFKF